MACLVANKKTRIFCVVCGKERAVTPTQLKQGSRFCSWECARQVLSQPLRAELICAQCGQTFSVHRYRVKAGARFCSQSCRSIYNITQGAMASPTSIEIILYQTLDLLNVEYIRQHPIPEAGTVPDAYVPDRRIALYADGAYWHALPKTAVRDQRQNQELTRLGYSVRRLTEADLRRNPVEAVRQALEL
jgi:G:T-mismatch repair DNA endonuclease (very short patch repair protein)